MIQAFPSEGWVRVEEVRTGTVQTLELETLIQAFFALQLTFPTSGRAPRAPLPGAEGECDLSEFTPKQAATARFRYGVIRPLLALNPKERTLARLKQWIIEVRQQATPDPGRATGPALSCRSIRRWIRQWQQRGGDIRSLIPSSGLCGKPGALRLVREIDAIIHQVVEALYLTRESLAVKDLRYEIAARIEAENRLRPESDHLRVPSLKAIYRRLAEWDVREKLEAKQGARTARRALRQHNRQARPDLPYDTIEMDSTPLDLIVVDDVDDLPLGRPTVTYGIDLATGYPAGFYVGFEPPSYGAVLECLHHSIWPKGDVRERYGTANAWPLCGVPARIVLDNGPEFNNRHLQDAGLALGIEVLYAPVRTPEFKARIERYFKTLNTGLVHTLPGTTFSNPPSRGDYNSSAQACLRLTDLIRVMHLFVVDVFAQEYHRGLDGIPARRWEAAQQKGFAPRLPESLQALRIQLGRVAYRTLQPYGIELEGLRYNAPALGLLRHKLKAGERLKLKFHPGDLSRVYVCNPFAASAAEAYLEVPACDPDGYTEHLSLWKHRVIRRLAREEAARRPDLVALGQAKQKIRALVQSAKGRRRERGRKRMARFEGQAPSLASSPAPVTAELLDVAPLPPFPPLPPARIAPFEADESALPEDWTLTFDRPSPTTRSS